MDELIQKLMQLESPCTLKVWVETEPGAEYWYARLSAKNYTIQKIIAYTVGGIHGNFRLYNPEGKIDCEFDDMISQLSDAIKEGGNDNG